MARALMGHVGTVSEQTLIFEVSRLRRRVAELQEELAQLREQQHVAMDMELHHIAEAAEPALA